MGGAWGEAGAGARVTKPQGSWAQRGQLLLGFRCPHRRQQRDGHRGHHHATPTLGHPAGQGGKGQLTARERGGGAAWELQPSRLWLGVPAEAGVVPWAPPAPRAGCQGEGGTAKPKGNGSEQSPGGAGASGASPAAPGGARKPEPSPREGTRPGTCARRHTAQHGPAAASASSPLLPGPGEEALGTRRGGK